ncbi:atypical chemokine receptor 4 [Latimeria chalumnae]|uniref:Atypical chemokine receptor 4 n=1 Tax=Latimeria chalumnae TaxID=7897 RepID=H3AGZ8_LATCH|nr:PREDICTED: atypical chemokine receptor 4 [Latimeria chalumnae]|eukprot:XP_006001382.1 PREDICTED: atypical chemokine receptor 4 [Latimeria chalumnae]
MESHENDTMEYYDEYEDGNLTSLDYADYSLLCVKEEVRNFGRYFRPYFYLIALVVGLAGNSTLVAVYAYYKKLKTMTDVFIVNLAVADLLLLFTLPFWVMDTVNGWVVGTAMCKINSALLVMNFSCGMLFLACISVDRYCAITRMTTFKATGKICWVVCSTVWLVAVFLSLPDLIFSIVQENNDRNECRSIFPNQLARPVKASILILEVLFSFVIPFTVMVTCYSAVARTLTRTPNVKKCKAFKVLVAVVGVFIVTQLPYNIVKTYRAFDTMYLFVLDCSISKTLDIAMQVTESIALFHSCLNPVLYAFMGASFRSHILKAIKKYSYKRRHRRQSDVEYSLNSHSHSEETTSFTI